MLQLVRSCLSCRRISARLRSFCGLAVTGETLWNVTLRASQSCSTQSHLLFPSSLVPSSGPARSVRVCTATSSGPAREPRGAARAQRESFASSALLCFHLSRSHLCHFFLFNSFVSPPRPSPRHDDKSILDRAFHLFFSRREQWDEG